MNNRILKYLDKLYYSFIDYIFRKKSLNFTIYVLITFAIAELTAIGSGEGLSNFINELKTHYESGIIYWILRLIETFFVEGSKFVLGVTIVLIIIISFVRRSEISKASSGERFNLIINQLEKEKEETKKKLKKAKTSTKTEITKKEEYKKFLDKINYTLQEKNISKEELIKKVSSKLKAIILYKSYEEGPQTDKKIRDFVYPHLGVTNISSGMSIIPPNRLNQRLTDKQLLDWFKKEVEKNIPQEYDYNFPIVAVLDLTKITAYKRLKPYRRFNRTYLDKIRIEDLVSMRELESYLYREKNISSKEIIETPSIIFLIDNDLISTEDYENLKKQNEKIITEIKELIGVDNLETTQFANMTDENLNQILGKYIENPENITENIKKNSAFWRNYFNKKM
jgi:hypothetical protein